jgi:ABC-type glycerol-3-phosphate transport system substrate-binding protein
MQMSKRTKLVAAGGSLVLAGFVGGAALAVTGSASAVTDAVTGSSRNAGSDEKPLTGTTADKVTAAVNAKYPGATIQRVETDSEGVYEAHIVTSSGEELTVQVDKDFAVTGTESGGPGHDRGFDSPEARTS